MFPLAEETEDERIPFSHLIDGHRDRHDFHDHRVLVRRQLKNGNRGDEKYHG
jgi:hypothetical protein